MTISQWKFQLGIVHFCNLILLTLLLMVLIYDYLLLNDVYNKHKGHIFNVFLQLCTWILEKVR